MSSAIVSIFLQQYAYLEKPSAHSSFSISFPSAFFVRFLPPWFCAKHCSACLVMLSLLLFSKCLSVLYFLLINFIKEIKKILLNTDDAVMYVYLWEVSKHAVKVVNIRPNCYRCWYVVHFVVTRNVTLWLYDEHLMDNFQLRNWLAGLNDTNPGRELFTPPQWGWYTPHSRWHTPQTVIPPLGVHWGCTV